jgi:hypothetical protein
MPEWLKKLLLFIISLLPNLINSMGFKPKKEEEKK